MRSVRLQIRYVEGMHLHFAGAVEDSHQLASEMYHNCEVFEHLLEPEVKFGNPVEVVDVVGPWDLVAAEDEN